jgi:serine/threonine protein kinase/alpha-tubulin suppressor-like RCC1 family protein
MSPRRRRDGAGGGKPQAERRTAPAEAPRPGPSALPRFAELETEYEVLQELGRGGTAVVYLARERELDRLVALKVIRPTYVEDPEAAARLTREARTISALQHPNIVTLYGTRRLGDGSLALLLQYVEGRTLKEELRATGPLPFDRVRSILTDLARALECAHRRRIVHRDLKPENIYLDAETGAARLSDFGIARSWGEASSLTLPGSAIGTPAYMSPEQVDGAALDGRSDIYSLGLVAWEMLTGRQPWAGENLYAIISRQKNDTLPPLAELRPDTPVALSTIVERALQKEPDARWPDADALLTALEEKSARRRRRGSRGGRRGRAADAAASSPETNATVRYIRPVPPRPAEVPAPERLPDPPVPEAARPSLPAAEVPAAATAVEPAPVPDSTPVPDATVRVEDADSMAWRDTLSRRRRRPVAAGLAALIVATPLLLAIGHATSRADAAATAPAAAALELPAVVPADAGRPDAGAALAAPALAYVLVGDEQEAFAGDSANDMLVLRVEDATGRPVAGVPVRFRLTQGAGSVEPAEAVTDELGMAYARWLPAESGEHRVEAQVQGLDDAPTRFRMLARDRAADALGMAVAADAGGTGVPRSAAGAGGGSASAPAAPALAVQRGMAAGGMHTCWLDGAGAAWCWGGNDHGQLGDGSASRRAAPVAVAAPERLARLAAGMTHSCGIGVSGTGFCWGANDDGQLGDGSRTRRAGPVRVGTDERLSAVAAGMAHSCALTVGGRLLCWGSNRHGQLGDGSRTDRPAPVPAAGGRSFRTLAAGWAHGCAIAADGRAFCWGRNDEGQVGDGGSVDRTQPTEVAGGHRFSAIAAGSAHTCGVRADGVLLCWGRNTHGQLGTGGGAAAGAPTPVASDLAFSAVVAGGNHACGLSRDGRAFCWGQNTYGQLGDGSQTDRSSPVAVAGGHRFSALEASGAHSCGTTTAGARLCWGFNLEGQLGNGTRANASRPVGAGRE